MIDVVIQDKIINESENSITYTYIKDTSDALDKDSSTMSTISDKDVNIQDINFNKDLSKSLNNTSIDDANVSFIIPMQDFNITGKSTDQTIKICISVHNFGAPIIIDGEAMDGIVNTPLEFKLIEKLVVESINIDTKKSFNNCINILKSETNRTLKLYLHNNAIGYDLTNGNGLCGYIIAYQMSNLYRINENKLDNYILSNPSINHYNLTHERLVKNINNYRLNIKDYIVQSQFKCRNSLKSDKNWELMAKECDDSCAIVNNWLETNYTDKNPVYQFPYRKNWFKTDWFQWFTDSKKINIIVFGNEEAENYCVLNHINENAGDFWSYFHFSQFIDNSYKLFNSGNHYYFYMGGDILMPKIDQALNNLLQNILRKFKNERHMLIQRKVEFCKDIKEKRYQHIQLYIDLNDLDLFRDFYAIENNKHESVVNPVRSSIVNERLKLLYDLFGYYYLIDDIYGNVCDSDNIKSQSSGSRFKNSRKLVIEDSDSEEQTPSSNASQKINNKLNKMIIESDSDNDTDGKPENINCDIHTIKRPKTFLKEIYLN